MTPNLCRACLKEDSVMFSLFKTYENDVTLAMILQNCIPVEISEDDNMPSTLCENCTLILIQFYNFSTVYKHNEKELKSSFIDIIENIDDENYVDETKICLERYNTTVDVRMSGENYVFDISKNNKTSSENIVNECKIDIKKGKIVKVNDDSVEKKLTKTFEMKKSSTQCNICQKVFPDSKSCNTHYQSHKTFVCEICGAQFIKKTYLNDHKEGHQNKYCYKCRFCGKAFRRRTVLVKHNRLHTHPKQCICEVCGKRFNAIGTLNTHKFLLHGGERKFVCIICNQHFPLKSTLDKHVRRHQTRATGIKEFLCDKCDMQYCDRSSLNRHIQFKHSGVAKRVNCDNCGKLYASEAGLRRHKKKHHSETTSENFVKHSK